MAIWGDGERLLEYIQEPWLDLMPFMAARLLLEQGYNAKRQLIVRLEGADYELLRAPLGAAAAPPLVNIASPVQQGTRGVVYRETHRG